MKLPGRSGALSASGLWQDAGSSNALPANPVYNSRTGNEPLEYRATETISFMEGFESGVNDAFEAYITTDNGSGSGSGGSGAGLYADGGYRYGFNGKEQDPETYGDANIYDYGFRIYNPRIGRFLSVDPLTKKYPELTPYQFASNRPIDGVDLDGLEYATFHIYVDKNQKVTKVTVTTDYELKNNGTEGPGVKYVIFKVDEGYRPDEVRWSKNIYGIYQGPDNPRMPKVGKNYNVLYDDYRLAPIDEADANAKQHDQDYDAVKVRGLGGVMDSKSTPANEAYIKRAGIIEEKQKKGEKDNITGKPVTKEAAKAAKKGSEFFQAAESLKKMKGMRIPTQ
ncbi:RHS repeat-associated core domain-containing protein [Flavisolibacter nicotianae]|uniref:RHS repeat-associated core domain-containing protein n=1 Tax=Flavisolibacter nicotianae TaxID=2364882 RepID=UPI000EACBBA5|nr:RHS repeat-associated core domain-containing protein [Flavisolibacter nicotianae]